MLKVHYTINWKYRDNNAEIKEKFKARRRTLKACVWKEIEIVNITRIEGINIGNVVGKLSGNLPRIHAKQTRKDLE